MLKRRIEKLEEHSRGNRGNSEELHVVEENKEENTMTIQSINFKGSINEGKALMEKYPDELFVVFSVG